MSNTGTINIALKIDDKGSVKVLQNVGRESKSTGEKGEKAFRDMDKSAGSFNKNAKITTSTLMKMGAAVGGIAAVAKAYSMLKSAAEEYIALAGVQEAAEKKLEAVLKATGGAAGYNIDQLKAMAGQMQQVTRYGDEVTLSAMAILATFKQVRGEGFERATKAAMDMATVMGTDLNSNILQIGKALNDPLKGITALNRAGVQFTDQQKDQIAALQASGQMMEAQNMILKELEIQFGGAAEAMATDFTGRVIQAENALGDLKEELGFVITKNQVFIELAKLSKEYFERLTEEVKNNREALMQNAKSGVVVLTYLIDTVVILSRNFELSGKIVAVMFASLNAAAWEAAGVLVAGPIKALEYIVELYNKIPRLPDISLPAGLTDFADTIIASTELANQAVIEGVKNIGELLQRPLPGNAIRDAIEDISGAADDAAGSAGGLGDTLEDNKPNMDATAEAAWNLEAALKAIQYNEEAIQESWDDYITEMNRQIAREKAAYEKLQKDKADADEAAAEAMEKAHEKTVEEMERNYERLYDNIHDVNAELWRDLIDDGGNAFEIIKDKAEDVFAQIAATWSTQIMMNVITGGQGAAGMPFSGSGSGSGYGISPTSLLNLPTTAGTYNALTSGWLGDLGQTLFGTAWTGGAVPISTGALAAGGELGWGASTMAAMGSGSGMGGIASTLAAAAPWAAMAAVAVPVVLSLLEDEPTPRIGIFAGTHNADITPTSDQYWYHTGFQDVGGRDELGNELINYFDARFSMLDTATTRSIDEIMQEAGDWGQSAWTDPEMYGGDTQAMMDAIEAAVMRHLNDFLVSDVIGEGFESVFDTDFFDAIAVEGEAAFDTFVRFSAVVQSSNDFMEQFTLQTKEFGLSAAQAYRNIETITVVMGEMDAAVSVITSSSALSSIAASVELWNSRIEVLEQANASLEQVTEAEENRNLAIGAQITGLTVDSLANALKSGQGAGDVITEAINELFRQQEAEDLFAELSPVIEEAGRIWHDTGGDIDEVTDYLKDAGYYFEALSESMDTFVREAELIVAEVLQGSLTAGQMFEQWGIQNAEAQALFSDMISDTVTRSELESAVDAFRDLGLEGEDLTTVIQYLADASAELGSALSGEDDALSGLPGGSSSSSGSGGDPDAAFEAAFERFLDAPTLAEIMTGGTPDYVETDVLDADVYRAAFDAWALDARYVDAGYAQRAVDAANEQGMNQENGEPWTVAAFNAYLDDMNWTTQQHYMYIGGANGVDPYVMGDPAQHWETVGNSLSDFLSSVDVGDFLTVTKEEIPGTGGTAPVSSEKEISAALAVLNEFQSSDFDIFVDYQKFFDALRDIGDQVLLDIFGQDAETITRQLESAYNDYEQSVSDTAAAVSAASDEEQRRLEQIESIVDQAQGYLDTLDMTDLEKQIYDVEKRASDWIEQLEELGAAEEKLAVVRKWSQEQINAVTEEFRLNERDALISGIVAFNEALDDTYRVAGQAVLELSDLRQDGDMFSRTGMNYLATVIDNLNESIYSAEDGIFDFSATLTNFGAAFEVLNHYLVNDLITTEQYSYIVGELTDRYAESIKQIKAAKDEYEGLVNTIEDTIKRITSSTESLTGNADALFSGFQDAYAYASAMSGDASAVSDMTSFATSYLDAFAKTTTSRVEYERQQGYVLRSLKDVKAGTEDQVEAADEMLELAKDQVVDISQIADLSNEQLAGLYSIDDTIVDLFEWMQTNAEAEANFLAVMFENYLGDNSTLAQLLAGLNAAQAGFEDFAKVDSQLNPDQKDLIKDADPDMGQEWYVGTSGMLYGITPGNFDELRQNNPYEGFQEVTDYARYLQTGVLSGEMLGEKYDPLMDPAALDKTLTEGMMNQAVEALETATNYDWWLDDATNGLRAQKPGANHPFFYGMDYNNMSSADLADILNKYGADSSWLQFSGGGILSGPDSGYPVLATFHGDEAVVPLKGGAIPVQIDYDDLIGEVQGLRRDVSTLRHGIYQIAKNTRNTADLLEFLEGGEGSLPTREAV